MYSRIELKKTARNIKRVARQNDVSEEEVRRDMLVAMNAARSNDDPAVKARWETFHYSGSEPTLEEFLVWCSHLAKEPLTDAQAKTLLDTIRGLPPYVFVMIGLYSGLRREEILALQWDCVFLDAPTPYISVRRAWHEESNRLVINTELKTKSARRDVPIPKVLVDCLREEKAKTTSDYVIADSEGQPLSYSQFVRIWNYIKVRSTGERTLYKYVNGQSIKKKVTLELGQKCRNKPSIVYTIDFPVTPHLLRHTYITNLIHAGVDPKTVQHLVGHKNSKVTMDIYAKVKYNKPEQLSAVVNEALEK